jgi:hypothetical protein
MNISYDYHQGKIYCFKVKISISEIQLWKKNNYRQVTFKKIIINLSI